MKGFNYWMWRSQNLVLGTEKLKDYQIIGLANK